MQSTEPLSYRCLLCMPASTHRTWMDFEAHQARAHSQPVRVSVAGALSVTTLGEKRILRALRNTPRDWLHALSQVTEGEGSSAVDGVGNDWGDELSTAFLVLRDERPDAELEHIDAPAELGGGEG